MLHLRPAQPIASTSQQAPATVVCAPTTGDKLDQLTQLLSDFIEKLLILRATEQNILLVLNTILTTYRHQMAKYPIIIMMETTL